MNVVWGQHPTTAGKVLQSLPADRGWAQKTVNTFLARLVEKGVLSAQRKGKANIYRPLIAREQCVASEGDHFLQRVFQGAAGPLMLHFCERADLSPEEIRELEQLLRAKRNT